MSRDEKLRANQRTLAARRRAKRIADAKKKKESAPKTESKPKTRTNTSVAFDKKNDFSVFLKDNKPKTETPQRPPQGSQDGPKDPPKPPRTTRPETHSAHNRTVPYRSRAQGLSQSNNDGTNGKPMPSNPAVGYSKPVRRDFKTQAAFLKALEVYMRRQNRGRDAANSVKKRTTKVMDGRQYGG